MSGVGGRKSPSVRSEGSRLSVYSHASTTRSTRTLGHSRGQKTLKSQKSKWWEKPLVTTAFYTDLTKGAWHATFYTLFLSFWTGMWSIFDIYCLVEASPGSNHTGYYIFSFDFVYVGNHHVRNLLMMSSLFSLVLAVFIFITSCILLDALRLEKETGFKGWLYTMGVFTPWKIVAWIYHSIVNDIIFGYHIFQFFNWLILNIIDVGAWVVIYSLFLELNSISKLEDMAKIKMVTLSSRAGSVYGSRPTSPHTRSMSGVGVGDNLGTLKSNKSQNIEYDYVPRPDFAPRRNQY